MIDKDQQSIPHNWGEPTMINHTKSMERKRKQFIKYYSKKKTRITMRTNPFSRPKHSEIR